MLDEPSALSVHRDKEVSLLYTVGGEARLRGRTSTNFRPEVWLQTLIRSANTPPSLPSRVKLQSEARVLRYLIRRLATPPCFSAINHTTVLVRNLAGQSHLRVGTSTIGHVMPATLIVALLYWCLLQATNLLRYNGSGKASFRLKRSDLDTRADIWYTVRRH
jgi:hypothetical protein